MQGSEAGRFVVTLAQSGERVDKLLSTLLPDVSRATVQRWIEEGHVLLDGRSCRARDRAKPGAVLEWTAGPPALSMAEPDASVVFRVVHEDEHLIVVDKPPGVVVHPARGHRHGTLVSGLLARGGFDQLSTDSRDEQGHLRPGIVHRIDKHTSGLLVVAKNDKTREGLKAQFSERTVRREYRAITLGVPQVERIATSYGRHPKSRLRFSSVVSSGKPAITTVRVIERLAASNVAWVACTLSTGRTHQIRVHLLEQANSPVFADSLYQGMPKDPRLLAIATALGRQALHAHTLGFIHPITSKQLDFVAPIPADMQLALDALRAL